MEVYLKYDFILYEMGKLLYNVGYNKLGGMAMNCMRCGRETQAEDVFCQSCLMDMAKHPIQPGTVVLLPRRREPSVVKKTMKRHMPSQEEQIKLLRKRVMILTLLLAAAVTAIVLMFNPTMHYVMDQHFEIGQNYSSVMPSTATPAPSRAE